MNYKNDRSINLRRLFFTCLKKWRAVFIFVIIGALASCAYFYQSETRMLTVGASITNEYLAEIAMNDERIVQIESISARRGELDEYTLLLDETRALRETAAEADKLAVIARIIELKNTIAVISDELAAAELSVVEIVSAGAEQTGEVVFSDAAAQEAVALLRQRNEELTAAMEPYPDLKSTADYIKYAILGIGLGGIAAVAYLIARFILSGTIDGADSVREYYGVAVLANLHLSNGKPNTWIDRLLKKWNGELLSIDFDSEYELLAAKLQAVCPDSCGEILVCSTADADGVEKLCAGVQGFLGKDTAIRAIGNPALDVKAAKAAKNAVVLVAEETDRSRFEAVDRLAEQLELSSAQVLGFVLI